ncbi:MAG: hypothetical protein JXA20_12400 [Spirochaetes bacterium]|nr:hypothetical protein [Spirochaetota bacterium]
MKRTILQLLCPRALCVLLLFSCTPELHFTIDPQLRHAPAPGLYIEEIDDRRPQNEKTGYDVLYLKSISDGDYRKGFAAELDGALRKSLGRAFRIVPDRDGAELRMKVTVRHFYGEYDRSVTATVYELGSALLLFIPRLVTNMIPYDRFAGRAAMDLAFTDSRGATAVKSFDVLVRDTVSAYRRGSAHTAAELCGATSRELNRIVGEILADR